MSLRARMGLAAGVAVAVAVIAVAVSAYAGTRSELQGQLDTSLSHLIQPLLVNAGVAKGPMPGARRRRRGSAAGLPGRPPGFGGHGFTRTIATRAWGSTTRAAAGFGGPQGYVQLVEPRPARCAWPSGETTKLPVDGAVKALARTRQRPVPSATSRWAPPPAGARPRRGPLRGGPGGAAAHPGRRRPLQPAAAARRSSPPAGIALAALLGLLVARTALSPIARFTRQTETIAAHPDRLDAERLDVHGGDELARLAQTFNRTLDALERSVAVPAQPRRRCLARAAHADRHHPRQPPAHARRGAALARRPRGAAPRRDRGARRAHRARRRRRGARARHEAGRRAGRGPRRSDRLRRGGADAPPRAAADRHGLRWSPPWCRARATGSPGPWPTCSTTPPSTASQAAPSRSRWPTVTLTVRDHGPGFHEEDLPFVFDRFHRARDARSQPGSGLGLAIVRQAAEAHGGFVRAGQRPRRRRAAGDRLRADAGARRCRRCPTWSAGARRAPSAGRAAAAPATACRRTRRRAAGEAAADPRWSGGSSTGRPVAVSRAPRRREPLRRGPWRCGRRRPGGSSHRR